MIDQEPLRSYLRGEMYDTALLESTIRDVIKVVYGRYYKGYPELKEELANVGMEKAISLLHSEHADPTKNLVNFLFTGIRNEMSNFIRRSQKVPLVPLDEAMQVSGGISANFLEVDDFREVLSGVLKSFAFVGLALRRLEEAVVYGQMPSDLNYDENMALAIAGIRFGELAEIWPVVKEGRLNGYR